MITQVELERRRRRMRQRIRLTVLQRQMSALDRAAGGDDGAAGPEESGDRVQPAA
ncbi:MAG TPA: hypothetical protein VKY81_02920 [Natronosporangium sp.]|nr:hypothetical protein [Natronosporangium sp.]